MRLEYRIVSGPAAEGIVRSVVSVPGASDSAGTFFRFVKRYQLDVSLQAAAFEGTTPVASCLFIRNRGDAGTVLLPVEFPNLPAEYRYEDVARRLLRLIARQLEPLDLALIQAMAEPHEEHKIKLFTSVGFARLAELIMMQAAVELDANDNDNDNDQRPPAGRWVAYQDDLAGRFGQTIVETYRGSLDCPELTGLRTADEIIEGHRYSGIHEPAGWWLLQVDGRDAGVLLLNASEEDPQRLELVYMGIVDWARGKGFGKEVLRQAMRIANNLGKTKIKLAVDTRNTPAIKLYQRFGFQETSRQVSLAILNERRKKRGQ